MEFKKPSFLIRMKLLRGVHRRLHLNWFRPDYISASLTNRLGECQRCGACCQLGWRCRYLQKDAKEIPSCRIHTGWRPPNCHAFPIDQRDIADRDLIAPDVPCGFSWAEPEDQSSCESIKPARNGRRFRRGWFEEKDQPAER
jgi:hypothetical protein